MTTKLKPRYAADLMEGQVALVTGSGSGMGRATALEMAGCGARLALFARREEPLEETAEMIRAMGGEAFVVPGDTRDENSVEVAMLKIKKHYGQLDVLVNNAGGQYIAAARDITNKGFEARYTIMPEISSAAPIRFRTDRFSICHCSGVIGRLYHRRGCIR